MRYPRLADATAWAASLHLSEEREGNDPLPYVYHPMDVVRRLYRAGVRDEDVLVAGALHDAIEAGHASSDAIEARYGPTCAKLVKEMTRTEPANGQAVGLTAEELAVLRADLLVRDVERMSPAAAQIKLADRLSNLAEARRLRGERALRRYAMQSRRILNAIPPEVHPRLWRSLEAMIRKAEG